MESALIQAMVWGFFNKDFAAQIVYLVETIFITTIFIALDQSSKLIAGLTLARHEDLGLKKYILSESFDACVLVSHAEKDGLIFEFSNLPAYTCYFGHDYNCWCFQIAVIDIEQANFEN